MLYISLPASLGRSNLNGPVHASHSPWGGQRWGPAQAVLLCAHRPPGRSSGVPRPFLHRLQTLRTLTHPLNLAPQSGAPEVQQTPGMIAVRIASPCAPALL